MQSRPLSDLQRLKNIQAIKAGREVLALGRFLILRDGFTALGYGHKTKKESKLHIIGINEVWLD